MGYVPPKPMRQETVDKLKAAGYTLEDLYELNGVGKKQMEKVNAQANVAKLLLPIIGVAIFAVVLVAIFTL